MNKAALIDRVWEKTQLQKKDCGAVLDAALEAITEALGSGEAVRLTGFGSFETKARKERIGRNPQTKAPVIIPASRVPVFKAGKALKEAVQS